MLSKREAQICCLLFNLMIFVTSGIWAPNISDILGIDWNPEIHLSPAEFTANIKDPDNMSGCKYFPDGFVIGVQKSGTTALFELMDACDSYCYIQKELHVLDNAISTDKISQEEICQDYKKQYIWSGDPTIDDDEEEEEEERPHKEASTTSQTLLALALVKEEETGLTSAFIQKKHRKRPDTCIGITPSHAISSRAAKFIRHSKSKTLLFLRDPLDRMVSDLNMIIDRTYENVTAAIINRTLHSTDTAVRDLLRQSSSQRIMAQDIQKLRGGAVTSQIHFEILRSCYDRIFYLYSGVPLQIVFYEDFTRCSDDLFDEDLLEFLGPGMASSVQCMKKKCPNMPAVFSSKSYVSREDLPPAVVKYIVDRNLWYYKELNKTRMRRR